MTTRAEVVAEAREWIGTRWHHQQSKKGVGTDCIGLIVGVARELGIAEARAFDRAPEVKGYGREPDPHMTAKACSCYLEPAKVLLPGHILYLRVPKVSRPMHFALISDAGYMIHATATVRKVVEHRLDDVWRARIAGIYVYRGIDG